MKEAALPDCEMRSKSGQEPYSFNVPDSQAVVTGRS